jgi:hypothetical protein
MVDFTGKIHTSGIYLASHHKYNIINMQSVQVLDQHDKLDFYNASSTTQQSADRHVAPLGHIILIPSQPVFALSS